MPSPSNLLTDDCELCLTLLSRRPSSQSESASPIFSADVREFQKVECLQSTASNPDGLRFCRLPKPKYPVFLCVQAQTELSESVGHCSTQGVCIALVLKAHHEVV